MKNFLFGFAIVGYTLGLLVHLLAVAGIDATASVPVVWLLHVGIFIVVVPSIFMAKADKARAAEKGEKEENGRSWDRFAPNAPNWVKVAALLGFVYAVINFMYFIGNIQGSTSIKDGQYTLHNHGTLIRVLTEAEYHQINAQVVRGFSGHWIAFYGMAVASMFPARKKEEEKDTPPAA